MCKVSGKTIVRANKRTMGCFVDFSHVAPSRLDAIVVGTSYNGRNYTKEITISQINESYGRALNSVQKNYGKIK